MTKLSNIKAIGFDLDDTLVMTEGSAYEFTNRVLAKMGRVPMNRDVHKNTWGEQIMEAMKIRSPGINIDEFAKMFAAEFKLRLENEIIDPLTEETEKTLLELGKKDYYLFLLTGRDGFETAHLTAGDHPISVHIAPENIYHKDNLPYQKPDPRAFDWLWKKGFNPSECIFVGDSLYDAKAATGAGLRFIATLEGGLRKKADFSGVPVTMFINRFSELVDILA